jgi:glycosyltransferase involved in cell wall biosynthesis
VESCTWFNTEGEIVFVSVILSTCDSPEWLRKVVWGYAGQTHHPFELVIADDGSAGDTAACIEQLRSDTQLALRHLWQPKRGFGKCRILNRAIAASAAEYLIFSDGDCIPRRDFVAQHVRLAQPGRFLSGGVVRLSPELSDRITIDDIARGRATSPRWLVAQGFPRSRKLRLLVGGGAVAGLSDTLSTTRATFNGHNASAWKSDLLRVNGFDERMGYGGLDRELGERLVNAGVRPRQIRHRAACIHLDHPRSYVDPDCLARNRAIREETRANRFAWTPYGIRQVAELLRLVGDAVPACAAQRSATTGWPSTSARKAA